MSLSLEEIRQLENRLRAKQKQRRFPPAPPAEPKKETVETTETDKWGEMTSTGEGVTVEDVRALANRLKQRRILWGLTQGQLGELICYKYGARLSQTTVSRFEMMDCTVSTAKRLYRPMKEMLELIDELYEKNGPQLTEALCEAVRKSIGDVAPTVRERKRRVTYTDEQLATLDAFFAQCESPTSTQLNRFATSLGLDFSEVRVWFCNRRQKRRRIMSSKSRKNSEDTTPEILTRLESRELKGFLKPPTIRARLQKQGTDLAPIIASLDRMPKEEIVINVSQKA